MNILPFLYWINARETIRLKRAAGEPPPWTDDPILQQYRFCNVRREDDKVTIWIRENIRERYVDHPELWWMLALARTINWPDTIAEIIAADAWSTRQGFTPSDMTPILEARKARGEKVETGAYMIRPESDHTVFWFSWSKQRYVAEVVLGRLWDDRAQWNNIPTTLAAKHAWLMGHRGWGPFMAFQAVVDMCFTPILSSAEDWGKWAAAGPGTLRGLNRLNERNPKVPLSQERALNELKALEALLRKETDVNFDWTDVPNICCEVDKMLRIKNGEGRPRNLYRGSQR